MTIAVDRETIEQAADQLAMASSQR